jgi:hypothetical protein
MLDRGTIRLIFNQLSYYRTNYPRHPTLLDSFRETSDVKVEMKINAQGGLLPERALEAR